MWCCLYWKKRSRSSQIPTFQYCFLHLSKQTNIFKNKYSLHIYYFQAVSACFCCPISNLCLLSWVVILSQTFWVRLYFHTAVTKTDAHMFDDKNVTKCKCMYSTALSSSLSHTHTHTLVLSPILWRWILSEFDRHVDKHTLHAPFLD